MNRELVVHTRSHDYPIIIGKKLIETFDFSDYISGHQVLVVTNETVAPLYLSTLLAQLPQNKTVVTCILPDGEQYKSLTVLNDVFSALLENSLQT